MLKPLTRDDFACHCGCGTNKITDETVQRANEAQTAAGVQFKITSGYRCPTHNAAVGGSPTSSHLLGTAFDFAIVSDAARAAVIWALHAVGITRIGVAKTYLHADIDQTKPQNRIWVY